MLVFRELITSHIKNIAFEMRNLRNKTNLVFNLHIITHAGNNKRIVMDFTDKQVHLTQIPTKTMVYI